MLQLLDAAVAGDEQRVGVFRSRIDAGNRGRRVVSIIRGIGEGFGGRSERGAVLRREGKRGEIGMGVGERRRGLAKNLLGAEVEVDALGVPRGTQRTRGRERVVLLRALHAEGRLRDVLARSELAAAVEALGRQRSTQGVPRESIACESAWIVWCRCPAHELRGKSGY